ncbi:2Fe-2S iron-sulfur cluster-binding protein [Photobacterium leiognathi]|uniref:2Fe-2S iron-sulfur cluster-binding protein n=1 Tax=Photobacterium leiognathi TaxID=553611 RepID=UPI00387F906E
MSKSVDLFVHPSNTLTLLELLEMNGMTVQYNCRSGFCGVCRLVVNDLSKVDGDCEKRGMDNSVLSCCAVPNDSLEVFMSGDLSGNLLYKR